MRWIYKSADMLPQLRVMCLYPSYYFNIKISVKIIVLTFFILYNHVIKKGGNDEKKYY